MPSRNDLDADDLDVDDFTAKAEQKHRAYWAMPPPVQPNIRVPCKRCNGTGRAPSPVGHVRCSLCDGTGEGKQTAKALIK
jgi:hypothetical protein